jgi:hypothetical protein
MSASMQWRRGVWTVGLTAFFLLVLNRPVAAQNFGGVTVGRTTFSNAFSGPIITSPLGFRGMPSLPAFPGSAFAPLRTPSLAPAPNGFAAGATPGNLFGLTFGNPLTAYQTGLSNPAQPDLTNAAVTTPVPTGQVNAIGTPPVAVPYASVPADLVNTFGATGVVVGSSTLGVTGTTGISLGSVVPSTAKPGVPAYAGPLRRREDLERIIKRSSDLPSRDSIRVLTDGPSVILRGEVLSDHERLFAEALLRLEPGVRQIRNELTVRPPPKLSSSG